MERLSGASQVLHERCIDFLQRCAAANFWLLIVRVWSSPDAQRELYLKGREYDRAEGVWKIIDESKVVTKAKPGLSAHNVVTLSDKPASVAIDVVPLVGALPDWKAPRETWLKLYAISDLVGLDAYGDPKGAYLPWDKGHFELPNWKANLSGWGLKLPNYSL
jgi:peptidoglycan L-alanyl-D-glutamate endopeptidase CwlK